MKANQIINTLAELVSKIEQLNYNGAPPYCVDYAQSKTAALVAAAQELERLSEAEHSLPHIAPITTKLAEVKERSEQ